MQVENEEEKNLEIEEAEETAQLVGEETPAPFDGENATLSWTAFEHDHVERTSDWFWALGIVAVCAALTSILFHDLFFAVIILLAAFMLGWLARTPQELLEFEITETGIRTGDEMHVYEDIIAFWVIHDAVRPLLLVDTVKFMSPNLIIPIHDIDPDEISAYLREHAKEVEMKEPLAHKILEFFGL